MPVLKKFMCCGKLSTGAVIIGWAGLVFDVISLAANSAILAQLGCSPKLVGYIEYKAPLAVILACSAISILANISLLLGANIKNRLFLLPWLTISMLIIVFIFVVFFAFGIFMIFSPTPGASLGFFLLGFLSTGIMLYMWLCILSLFQELREGGDNVITLAPPASCGLPLYSDLQEP